MWCLVSFHQMGLCWLLPLMTPGWLSGTITRPPSSWNWGKDKNTKGRGSVVWWFTHVLHMGKFAGSVPAKSANLLWGWVRKGIRCKTAKTNMLSCRSWQCFFCSGRPNIIMYWKPKKLILAEDDFFFSTKVPVLWGCDKTLCNFSFPFFANIWRLPDSKTRASAFLQAPLPSSFTHFCWGSEWSMGSLCELLPRWTTHRQCHRWQVRMSV